MFALLGDILFEALTSPQAMESVSSFDYAEHKVVEDRPRLQWISEGLQLITIDVALHASFTNPTLQLVALKSAAELHSPLPLVLGTGEYRGYFVITSIQITSTQMTMSGALIAVTTRLVLKEWPWQSKVIAGGVPLPSFPLLGVVPAPQGQVTAPASYTPPLSTAATSPTTGISYSPAAIPAPGVSPLLNLPVATGPLAPNVLPEDVPVSTILRTL